MNTPTDTDSDPGADGVDSVSDKTADRFYRWLIIGLGGAVVAVGVVMLTVWLTSDDGVQEPLGEVDIGFMQDMLDHHDQALVLSEAYLDCNPDGDAAPYAFEVIMFQERDIGRMEEWLAEDGSARGAPDRMTMTWMGSETGMAMGMPVAEMQGMQSQERIDELAAACGAEGDELFFELMTAHHLGGVAMADYAAEHGESEFLRVFAAGVSRNQQLEVIEYEGAVRRLGL